MIVQWMLDVVSGIVGWITGLSPQLVIPDGILHADDSINSVLDQLNGLGAFVPWSFIIACVGISIGVYVACFALKTTLRIASYLPFVGGAG